MRVGEDAVEQGVTEIGEEGPRGRVKRHRPRSDSIDPSAELAVETGRSRWPALRECLEDGLKDLLSHPLEEEEEEKNADRRRLWRFFQLSK